MDTKDTSSLCSALFHSNIGKSVIHRIECLDYTSEREKQVMLDTARLFESRRWDANLPDQPNTGHGLQIP